MEEERNGLTIKDLLIRLILIVIFIFLLIWLFPMPDLKPLNNQIFADNIDRMKDVAKSYYTVERLPQNINDFKKMTLREMIDNKLILPLTDSNGKTCNKDDSYIKITKLENEYVIKIYLSCSDKKDYIITHFGCYDICSDTCKALETTTVKRIDDTTKVNSKTTLKSTTTTTKRVTTSFVAKLYEYQYTKRVCTEEFEKYECQAGYNLVGNVCIKNNSEVVSDDASVKVVKITNTDTKNAKVVTDKLTSYVDASCKNVNKTSTINATKKTSTKDATKKEKVQVVTASKVNSYDTKGAIITKKTTNSDYIKVQNYSVITATKYATEFKWTYVSTVKSDKSNLGYVKDSEKLVLIDIESVPTCKTCVTLENVYTYYKYEKKATKYEYSCDNFEGYKLYDTNKCRKKTNITKKCPDGYKANGDVCSKTEETMSCSKYGSKYVLDKDKKTCTKTTTKYKCPSGTTKTDDPKYCNKKVYEYVCPSGTTKTSNNKCSKITYLCPSNTSDKTYKLSGTKCTVTTKVKECTCPSGTSKTNNVEKCAKENSKTRYTCDDYSGYTLEGKKCIKTTVTDKKVYECKDNSYTLNGTKCVKTVNTSDTKNPSKKFKTSCDNEYIWSSKTSISGWTYTGNKREIN